MTITEKISLSLGALPCVLYLINKKKVDQTTVYLFPFLLLMLFISIFQSLNIFYFRINAMVWFRFYMFFEFYFVLYFFYKILKFKIITYILAVLYLVVYTYLLKDFSFNQLVFNDLSLNLIMVLTIIVLTVQWFIDVFKKMEDIPLYNRSDFYYISGLLLFYCGTFTLFLFVDYLQKNKINASPFFSISNYLNIIVSTMYALTILRFRIKK